MEYAINLITDRLVSAKQASKSTIYLCPVCKKPVSCRSGSKVPAYFAHMPGVGTLECDNFFPGQYTGHTKAQAPISTKRWKMELELQIPKERNRGGWFLELVLPPYQACHALMKLDVGGGRTQTLDMRGMDAGRRVMAELSTASYRITEFIGTPDPYFISGLDWECPGLPTSKAAVFTISGASNRGGFSRTQILKSFETFALLWQEPNEPNFPDELVVEWLRSRQGWSLAIVTIPDELTLDCITWLSTFTGLPFASPTSSIRPIWPFMTKKSNINVIDCIRSKVILLGLNKMSVEQQIICQEIIVENWPERRSVSSNNRPTAFFALSLEDVDVFTVEDGNDAKIKERFSFSLSVNQPKYPAVELAFITLDGNRNVVSLHQRRCFEMAMQTRKQGIELEYLSMPVGVKGKLYVNGSAGNNEIEIFSSELAAPHDQCMRLPSTDILDKISLAWSNPENHVTIDFNGFGSLHLAGIWESKTASFSQRELNPALKSRLISFLFQLRPTTPIDIDLNDKALINALVMARPESRLIPHYRLLMKEVLANGFEISSLESGVLR